ncbi:MAG: hypothetical protein ACYSX1_11090 [Planctomycetota bacterium]
MSKIREYPNGGGKDYRWERCSRCSRLLWGEAELGLCVPCTRLEYPWLNGGNPEHNCPETGEPAWCYHRCADAKRQRRELHKQFSNELRMYSKDSTIK